MDPRSLPSREGPPPRRLLFLAILIAGIAAVSSAAVLIRLASDVEPLAVVAWRLILASAILAPFALLRTVPRAISRRDRLLAAGTGGFLALHFVLWITSLRHTSVASSVVLVSSTPLFVGLGSALFLREKLRPAVLIGIPLSIVGAGLIGCGDLRQGGSTLAGDLLALGGAVMMAGGLLIGRRVRQRVRLVDYVFTSYGTAGILVLAACLVLRVPLLGFRGATYVYLGLLALGPQLIGHTTFNWALRYLPASTVAVLTLGEPIGSSFLAWVVLRERLTAWTGVGGTVTLSGIYLALRGSDRRGKAAEERVGERGAAGLGLESGIEQNRRAWEAGGPGRRRHRARKVGPK